MRYGKLTFNPTFFLHSYLLYFAFSFLAIFSQIYFKINFKK